jgi:hypothetical protein
VWTDGQYVRRVRFAKRPGNDISPDLDRYGGLIQFELWDFGVPVAHLDWSRLPDFTTEQALGLRAARWRARRRARLDPQERS